MSVPNLKRIAVSFKSYQGVPNFAPPQTPFPGARYGQKLISWRWSLLLPTNSEFGEDRFTQFRVIMVTDPQTHKHTHKHRHNHTHRQDRLQYTAPLASTQQQCNKGTAINFHSGITKQINQTIEVKLEYSGFVFICNLAIFLLTAVSSK